LLWQEIVAFRGDWQKPTVDVSPHPESGFEIRISGLVGRRRPVEIDHPSRYMVLDPESRTDEISGWEKDQPLPPLRYRVWFGELAFRNTTFAIDEGFAHGSPIPIPIVFTQVVGCDGTDNRRDNGVRFVADPT
jgi:hypothetical protein